MESVTQREEKVKVAIEIAIKVGLLALVVYLSYLIAKPFMAIVVWGIIIAVALSPLVDSLVKRFGHRKKIITEKVKEWPLIGKEAYAFWDHASQNLRETLAPFNEKIKKFAGSVFSAVGGFIGTVFMFVGSMIIAAVFLVGSEGAEKFYRAISRRVLGEKGDEWATLSTLTVRSVVMGVIGVAVIQATLALIGMALMGVPLAMVWAIVIMFLTIIQVPALLVIGPVIAYVFSQGSGTAEVIFTVYMLIVGASDGVLKPLLMGRGVDVPMLVILIGAIGGMMLMGMIGLFVGAVIFALAYTLFGFWMNEEEKQVEEI